jgi:two-component system OmpR family response regulator
MAAVSRSFNVDGLVQTAGKRRIDGGAMKLLFVEDDEDLAAYLVREVGARGHEVRHVLDGRDGLALATSERFDVAVIDRMLPAMRTSKVATPVLVLTNLSGVDERVEGLTAGADDYLAKPFALEELLARLAALARRPVLGESQTLLRVGDLEMNLLTRKVRNRAGEIDLQTREFELLEYFMRSEGRIVTRRMLLENVWGFHFDPRTNIVETHISRLRAKLDDGGGESPIQTIRGAGYILRAAS